jgi:hypothetical protein
MQRRFKKVAVLSLFFIKFLTCQLWHKLTYMMFTPVLRIRVRIRDPGCVKNQGPDPG